MVDKATATATRIVLNIKYLPSSGTFFEVAGITSITKVRYKVCDTRMAVTNAVFSPDCEENKKDN